MKAKILYWIPRILTILAILFMLMFSLDSLGGNEPIGRKILRLLVHNIPALILIGILIIAWRKEVAGGILFIVAFIAAAIFFRTFAGNPGSLIVILPFPLTGILFILHHYLYGRKSVSKGEKPQG
jgi:hypothetical protein